MKNKQQISNSYHGTTYVQGGINNIINNDPTITPKVEWFKVKDLKIPVKSKYGKWITVIGIIGSLASVYSSIHSLINIQISNLNAIAVFYLLSLAFLGLGIFLMHINKKYFFKSQHPLLPEFEIDDDKNLHLIKFQADCPYPKCNGKISLVSAKMGLCSRNRNHSVEFDHTAL